MSDIRPTPDQLYLSTRLNGNEFEAEFGAANVPVAGSGHHITIAALQRWNTVYGVTRTTEALRTAWGFPPLGGIENPYAYVQGILRGKP